MLYSSRLDFPYTGMYIINNGDRTKWYGQNGMDKIVYGQNGIGQNGMDKMVRTKWYNFIFCEHLKSVEFNIYLVTKSHK